MAVYTLSGSGIQTLSAGTTAMYLSITTLPAGLTRGRANPANHFDIGLLRFSDGTGFGPVIPVTGGPDWIAVPSGSTGMGYSILNGAVISATEVIGGVAPIPISLAGGPLAYMPHVITPASIQSIGTELSANNAAQVSNVAWVANTAILVPLRILEIFTCSNGFALSGSTASGHWDIGVYDDSMNLIAHTGSVAQVGVITLQSSALSITLQPGRYFLAMAADSGALTTSVNSLQTATRVRASGVRAAQPNFPLSTTPTLITPIMTGVPIFGIASYAP